jgi:FkbM family methyltransferase
MAVQGRQSLRIEHQSALATDILVSSYEAFDSGRSMSSIGSLRIRKLVYSFAHLQCWKALRMGVAPSIEHRKLLSKIGCDFIIDVGANRGQFSLVSRLVKPGVPIVAFEPIPAEAKVFRHVNSKCENIHLHQVALGDKANEGEIHLSRSADSSSLLPIGKMQTKLFPATDEIGTEKVSVKKLDDFKAEWEKYSRIVLKIDVQGFELPVLKGATETLKNCAYVYVECSEIELYVGQALYRDVATFLEQQGFGLQFRLNETIVDGQLIQADYLFSPQ